MTGRVNAWAQSGRISLWRYTGHERNYPGWHLNADADGCQSLLSLLAALAADGTGTRTVSITTPSRAQLDVPNNRRAAWVAPTRLRIVVSAEAAEWTFPHDPDPAVLVVGAAWLPRLHEGIADMARGRGDYAIGERNDGGLPLWFWW